MTHILVTGANGQLGSEINAISNDYLDLNLFFADRSSLDITDEQAIEEFLDRHPFQYLINGAAYTAVDKAESEPELAHQINVIGPSLLADACKKRGITLFHYSSDYVYHTEKNIPYLENSETAPKGIYAKTKLEGDLAIMKQGGSTIIFRTSWVYSSFGHNFVKTMLRLGKERDQLSIVFDQIGSPTYARDLAKASLDIIQKIEKGEIPRSQLNGVFHYSNEGVCSWYDFAKAIFNVAQIDCKVIPIESKDYPTPAQRPPFSVLNKSKFKNTFGLEIPYWRDSLKDCLDVF